MVHGLFRASGIVMFYRLHHDFGHRENPRDQFRLPGSVLASRGGSVLESAEAQVVQKLTMSVIIVDLFTAKFP